MDITIGGKWKKNNMETETKKTTGFIGGKFLPLHLGHVYAIMSASTQVDELYVICSTSEERDREICKRDGIKYIPPEQRLSWLGELLSDLENIKILHLQDFYGITDYNWEKGRDDVRKMIGKPIDFIFSSEYSYKEIFESLYPEAKHVIIDAKRTNVPISATDLRKDLFSHWDKLPNCVRSYFTKRVAIVGTESCGKSTLAKKLAKMYNTEYVEEVGRNYCINHSDKLTVQMFDSIAMDHFLLQEKKARQSSRVLFIDSDAVVTQFYLDMYFPGKKSPMIEEIVKLQQYDLVLYLEPDVKWVDDGLRVTGEDNIRKQNNERLKQMYRDKGIEFVSISGDYNQRFTSAKNLIDKLFKGSEAYLAGR